MRLYIIRHADPDYANKTITPHGHKEAQALAERLKKVGISRIYTSPMGRAQHTAQYTADATGITPKILPWTEELHVIDKITALDGKDKVAWALEGELIRGRGEFPTRENWHQLPELAGYDYRAHQQGLIKSSDAFLEELGYQRQGGVYKILEKNEERVAIFCHHGFALYWISHLLEITLPFVWCGLYLAPSSVTTVLMEMRSPEIAVPRALCIGDTSHVYAAGLPESHFGMRANID